MAKCLRGIIAAVLLLVLVLPVASCSQPQGAAVPSVTPDNGIPPGEFKIAWLTDEGATNRDITQLALKHIQALLRDKGWYATFRQEVISYSADGRYFVAGLIGKEAAAGKACDAYIVTPDIADDLLKKGVTQDLSTILPEAAPGYYSRYMYLFNGSISGLPAYIVPNIKGRSTAFFLRKDIAEKPGVHINNVSDIFSLLENGDKTQRIGASLHNYSGYFFNIFDLWAGEKGYYALSAYGISGMLYARFDDAGCTPVPLENIEGFKDFTDRYLKLVNDKRFISTTDIQQPSSESYIGFVGPVVKSIDTTFLLSQNKSGKDFVAFPLDGFAAAAQPDEASTGYYELVVPTTSKNALHIVKLMEWITSSQANYDLVNYGEEGKEYRFVDGRLEPLKNGKVLTKEDWNYNTTSVFYLINPHLFYDESLSRTTIYAAANYKDAATLKAKAPPMWAIEELRGNQWECARNFDDISIGMQSIQQMREELISGMVDSEFSNGRDSAQCMAELLGMKADTDKFVAAYAQRIQELRDGQEK